MQLRAILPQEAVVTVESSRARRPAPARPLGHFLQLQVEL